MRNKVYCSRRRSVKCEICHEKENFIHYLHDETMKHSEEKSAPDLTVPTHVFEEPFLMSSVESFLQLMMKDDLRD